MRELFLAGLCVTFFIIYLLVERYILSQRRQNIPLRICVTGTRGKSSITRLIASCLREAGFVVLAKTTGSKPAIIFPDGEEKEIKRRGSASILEEKKILKISTKLQIQALVLELMSIHPENSYAESVQMLNPQILIITNVRPDHLAQMGSSREEIARCFVSSIPENCTVFVPEEEFFPVFKEAAGRMNSELVQISRNSYKKYFESKQNLPSFEFEENIRLSLAVTEFLGVDREVALRGIKRVKPDFGSLKVWTKDFGSPPHRWHLVSGFAANDTESTRRILSSLQKKNLFSGKEIVGLLNLRRDRGDRTIQWMKALKDGFFPEFQKIFFIGEHAHALKRKLRSTEKKELFVLKTQAPQKIMVEISNKVKGEAVLVGMGNMGGFGQGLVEYWESVGRAYDV
ncbi:MAG: poly-gamma-glutamate synthase PgsB [Candidatus Aminicenantes bacterium]|nr:poly-gamma-glutamate synthase PgsB [Candidatus Aminicenantes bacterium]